MVSSLSYSYYGPILGHECRTDSHQAAQASWLSLRMLLHCLKLTGPGSPAQAPALLPYFCTTGRHKDDPKPYAQILLRTRKHVIRDVWVCLCTVLLAPLSMAQTLPSLGKAAKQAPV